MRICMGWASVALVALLACAAEEGADLGPRDEAGEILVQTELGLIEGRLEAGAHVFLGIPFAEPPTGPERWRPAVPKEPWAGTLRALGYGPACPQNDLGRGEYIGDEDCLHLNIWTPADRAPGERLPVLFFIHGGANVVGYAGDTTWLDYGAITRAERVVFVTVDYRLGPLGFLAHPALGAEEGGASGNYATTDVLEALRWVNRHIAAFGGDTSRLLVFGHSAGAVQTCYLLASPRSAGLFTRAMTLSGTCAALTQAHAEQRGIDSARALGCGEGGDVAACLRALPAREVIERLGWSMALGNVDGRVLPQPPMKVVRAGQGHPVPTVFSTTRDEYHNLLGVYLPAAAAEDAAELEASLASYFAAFVGGLSPIVAAAVGEQYPVDAFPSATEALEAALADFEFICPSRRLAAGANRPQAPAWRTIFDQGMTATGFDPDKAWHGIELGYAMGPAGGMTPGELTLRAETRALWARFADTGEPGGGGLPPWEPYDVERDNVLMLAEPPAMGFGVHRPQCAFWEALYLAYGW